MQGKCEQGSEKGTVSLRKIDRLAQQIQMMINKIFRKLKRDRRW